jgi:hypothetical protein
MPDHDPQAAWERFDAALNEIDPVSMLVLRAQLLIEEQLHRILASRLPAPHFAADASLRFPQLLSLVRAFFPDARLDDTWRVLREFNALRNRLAHHLEPADLEARICKIATEAAFPIKSASSEEEMLEAINHSLGWVFATLAHLPDKIQ